MSHPKKPTRAELQPKDHGKHLSADLQSFEELPDHMQQQLLLSDEAAKVTGKQRAKVENKITQPSTKKNNNP